MARVGAFAAITLLIALMIGCAEKTSSTEQTGLELVFDNCITFAAWVWIDGEYVGTFTSEQPSVIELAAGGHSIFARSNMVVGDSSYCWTRSFSVSDGQTTEVVLDCVGARCQSATTLEMLNPAIKQ